MQAILIDDRGEVWGNASARLRLAFAPTCSDDEFAEYLVRNLGFIAISPFGKSCQLRLRPATVASRAVESLIKWLGDHRFDRYVMSWHDADWRMELIGDRDLLARRILQLVSINQLVRPGDFISAPLAPEPLEGSRIFESLLRSWPSLAGNLHRDGLRNILNRLTNGRYFLVRVDPATQQFMYHEAGNGFTPINNDWLASVRSTPIDQQPDRAYARWVAQSYERVLASRAPAYEAVDAIVDTHKSGRHRIRYNRVMLPAHNEEGGWWLLGASAMDNRIDLRVKAT